MWIKVCGLQTVENAELLAGMDLDALGLNRYPESSRYVSREQAQQLASTVRERNPEVELIGVYVNEDPEVIRQDRDVIGLDRVQLHGDESPRTARELGKGTPVIKAFRVDENFSIDRVESYDCWAFLLDAYHPDRYGGTGETAPWETMRGWSRDHRIILAGGLHADNVSEALRRVEPWGVDVCSGVENERGLRDPSTVEEFIVAVRKTV